MAKSDVYCTYLGHSGFLIEHPDVTMIFDWYQGKLPAIRNDKPLCIFISHIHSDHFNLGIFGIAGKHPNVEIFMGYDYSMPEFDNMIFSFAGRVKDKISFFDGEQNLIVDIGETDIIVSSLRSTDMGVAFLVEIEDKTFFHAGDLFLMQTISQKDYTSRYVDMLINHPGEGLEDYGTYISNCENEFNSFTETLRGKTIDYAMIPLDPRFQDVGYKTVKRYMDIAVIKFWSPMHLWEKYEFVDDFLTQHPEYVANMIGVTKQESVRLQISVGERYTLFEAVKKKAGNSETDTQRRQGNPKQESVKQKASNSETDTQRLRDNPEQLEVKAWGPCSRNTYLSGSPADHVTFNSITDDQKIGDERNFVRIRRAGSGDKYSDKVQLKVGEEYEVAVWFDNNAASGLNKKENNGKGLAENVRLRIEAPEKVTRGTSAVIKGIISSTNAEPMKVWDTAYAYSESTVLLRYVANSATIHSLGDIDGTVLSSEALFSDKGAELGYWKDLWGVVPGGSEYSGYVTFCYKVDQAGFKIDSGAAVEGTTGYLKNVIAKPGDTLEFCLKYKNTGTIDQKSIIAYDRLPEGFEYVKGSSYFKSAYAGNKVSDRLFDGGINLGDYKPGDWMTLIYKVRIVDDYAIFPSGDTCVYNDASIATANGTGYVKVEITVHRE